MKISLSILLLFILNLSIAQEVKKLDSYECGELRKLILKHKELGRKILTEKSVGSLNKRIHLSKKQYRKSIELLEYSILNECNQSWNENSDQFQIVDCYIKMEEFDKAEQVLKILGNEFRFDVSPHGPYGDQFFDYYFKIRDRYSYYEELRKYGITIHCGNTFDYMSTGKYLLEQSIERSKILYEKQDWKFLVLFLQQVPISLANNNVKFEHYYKVLNQFLIEGILHVFQPEKILLSLQKCEIQEADINKFGYYSLNLEPFTHFIAFEGLKFGMHLDKKNDLNNKDLSGQILNDMWLTKGMKNAIYNK